MRFILCLLAVGAIDAPRTSHEARLVETADEDDVAATRHTRPCVARRSSFVNAAIEAHRRRVQRRPWEAAVPAIERPADSGEPPPLRAPPDL